MVRRLLRLLRRGARSEIGRVIPPIEASQFAVVVKEPHGVVGCIVPWNFPLLLLTWKLAPALAAGNTAVCKPSEVTPLSTLALAEIFEDLPDGTVNLVAGAGEIGAGISAHPGIDCVAFTGSVATGQKVGVACATRNARANLEMGGKDPFIVCSDIGDEGVQIAAKGGAWAAYLNAGQVCTSSERFYVMEDVYDDYVAAFVEFTKSLVIGDPLDPKTDIGPMVSAVQRGKAVAQVEAAVAAGAELLTGGGNAGQAKGHYLEPCVLTGVPEDSDLMTEETFGPVAPIVPVKTLEEAIEKANGLDFGLGANIYTRDLNTAITCLKRVRAGSVWINDPLTDNDAGPFGGFKNSGIGRELGTEGLDAFREAKHIHMDSVIEAKDWWYPYGSGREPRPSFALAAFGAGFRGRRIHLGQQGLLLFQRRVVSLRVRLAESFLLLRQDVPEVLEQGDEFGQRVLVALRRVEGLQVLDLLRRDLLDLTRGLGRRPRCSRCRRPCSPSSGRR